MEKKLFKIIPLTLGGLLGVGSVIGAASVANKSPIKVSAATGYGLFIDGVEFTDENLVIDSSDSTNIIAGSATFDATTNTLTLDNLSIESPAYRDIGVNSYYYVIAYEGSDLLNVHLSNDNSISSTAVPVNNEAAYALYSTAALAITGSEGSSGDFTGPALSYRNYGIYSKGSLTINTEGSIDATSRVGSQEGIIGESAGIYAEGDITISAGTITALAGESNGRSYGIFADTNSRTITIEGGTVAAYGSTSKYVSAGAMAKYFLMKDGDVTMIAGDSETGNSFGIYGVNGVIFKDGNLTSAGNNRAINSSYFSNDINGLGWTDFDGTEGKASVAVNSSANAISSFKRLVFPGKESITPVVSMSGYTYGGTVSTPSISGNTGEGEVTYYYNTTNSTTGGIEYKDITSTSLDAGTYYMYAVVAETDDYFGATSATVSFEIAKADVTFTAPTGVQNLSYTGSAQTLVSGGEVEHGTLYYKVNDGEYSVDLPTATDVGTYTVYYKVEGDENYNDVEEATLQVTIAVNDKTALSNAITEASNYYNSIVADYPEVADTLNTAITSASSVYDNDNVTTKQISDAVEALETALNNAKASISDHEKAEAVEDLIDAIGEVAFTTDCKDRIDAARAAYDALSADQKALVENYATLVAAGEAYADLASKGKTEIDDTEKGVSIATTDGTTIPENIDLRVEIRSSIAAKDVETDYAKIKAVLEKNEEITKVYDVKLIRTVDGVETEIQPSDIKEGTTINVKMVRPAEITSNDFRLLHIHTVDDVEFVSGYTLENNELSFNINRLSEFAFITKVAAKAGLPGWAIALIVIGAILVTCCLAYFLLFFVFNKWIKDEKDEDKAHRVLPFALGEKDGKKKLFAFPCKFFYREKEKVYKTKKEALDN